MKATTSPCCQTAMVYASITSIMLIHPRGLWPGPGSDVEPSDPVIAFGLQLVPAELSYTHSSRSRVQLCEAV